MRSGWLLLANVVLMLAHTSVGAAQEGTRAEEIEALRRQKSTLSEPVKRNRIEASMLWLQEKKLQEKLETPGAGYKGLRPRMGGLSTGSGFGFGVQYDRVRMLNDNIDFSLVAAASLKQYQYYQTKIDLPRLAGERLFFSADVRHRAMPQEDYFGPGGNSSTSNRSVYLYEDTTYGVRGGVRPLTWLRASLGIDLVQMNVGRGTDVRFPSTEQIFNDQDSPGLDRQPDFLKSEVSLAIDTRDSAGNPRTGGYYAVAHTNYQDRSFAEFGFRRFEAEFQQYVSFNAGHRVVAMRFHSAFDDPKSGQRVPFYLQQSLGGSNDLRGFREFRFRDKNQMVTNLEYRWEAFSGLDMALFADTGKVFSTRRDFDLKALEKSYGIGFRFNTAKAVILRIDIARSRGGTRAFIKFDNAF